ncbi:hypothetical protein IQ274_29920 [Nostoc sp. LEGE 12447]|uniref:hypothetical protein n=1 Tax=Nostoc sp. LEGE 12447 TaxID=1828640 RepID=UPI001883EC8B|nr:hypothetical protein [Nostoc sp. LEGE 12447]MBE9002310.1 hypothetical protein [Nostoc sp. LEGE 12447]
MWFWSADSVEQELFDLYAPALRSLGVNFNDEQLQDTLEAASYGLEDAFRSAIVYILWLEENLKPIYPTAILIEALANQWRTKYWKPEYLELEQLLSPGKRWWRAAVDKWGYDERNQLVADIFYDHGQEFIKFRNGKEILVDTAYKWGWNRVADYASPFSESNSSLRGINARES